MQVQVLPKSGKKRYGGVAVKTLTQFWWGVPWRRGSMLKD